MLKDSEIVQLRGNLDYQQKTQTGLKHIVVDLLNTSKGDLKPDISFFVKITYSIVKARVIRKELVSSSRDFLERLLNYELMWPRTPESVRGICEAEKEHYLWMRYDVARVEALFSHSHNLITDAEFRNIIKSHSSITADKNQRLAEITREMKQLLKLTLRSINSKGIYDKLIGLRAEEFYEANEDEIQRKFIAASKGGALGLLPEAVDEASNDE